MSIRGKLYFFFIVALVAGLDLFSKHWAFQYIGEYGTTTALHGDDKAVTIVPGFFYLTRVVNTGGIWGIGQEGWLSKALIVLRIVAVPGIIYFALRTPAAERVFLVALGLFCAGAIGNLYDNLFSAQGGVRDFLDFYLIGSTGYHWPTFNIADAGIDCGVALLLIHMFFGKKAGVAPAARDLESAQT
ncbi:MAG: signal peptidase II [Planctomycetes bacterium]|nr:signal peptidase II [Planctomycetota bacterium]